MLDSLFSLSLSLHRINRAVEHRARLSLPQLLVLLRLRHLPATSPQQLAGAVGIHPSTLTQTLHRLQRKRYVFVTRDPINARRKLISLTRVGRDAAESACRELERTLRPLQDGYGRVLDRALSCLALVNKELAGEDTPRRG